MANETTGQTVGASLVDADPVPKTDSLNDVLAEARETARDQLAAAWQIEIERAQEQLASGWRTHVERVFDRSRGRDLPRVNEEDFVGIRNRVQTMGDDDLRGGGR